MTDTIEQKSEKFLDKKRFAIISISLLVSIALTVLTFTSILKINFLDLYNLIIQGFEGGGLNLLWFFILALYVPFKFVVAIYPVSCRLKQMNIKIPFWERFLFTLTWSFLSFVTPANFITDPYTIFWLKTHKLSNVQASSIILSNAVLWQVIQMMITIPSIAIMISGYLNIISQTGGRLVFWMMIAGMAIDFFILAFLCGVCFSKNLQTRASLAFNWIKKSLKMKYHTNEQTKAKYLNRGEFLNQIKFFIFDWKSTLKICLFQAVAEIFLYLLLCTSILFILPKEYTVNIGAVFNEVNVAVTANKFIPLPGSQGTLEWCLTTIMNVEKSISSPMSDVRSLVDGSIIIWRLSSVYAPAVLGLFGFISLTLNQYRKVKKTGEIF